MTQLRFLFVSIGTFPVNFVGGGLKSAGTVQPRWSKATADGVDFLVQVVSFAVSDHRKRTLFATTILPVETFGSAGSRV